MRIARTTAVLPLLLIALTATPSPAAKGKSKRTTPLESLQYCLNQLDLSADQKPKVDDILADAQKQIDNLRHRGKSKSDRTPGDDAARQKPRTLLRDIRTRLDAVLTPDQKAKLRKLLADEHSLRKEDQQTHRRRKNSPATTQPAA